MQSTLNCSVCRPPELNRLIASEPDFVGHWLALPRRQLATKTVLHGAGNALDRTWLVERGLVRSYFSTPQGGEHNRGFHAEGAWVGAGVVPVPNVCPFTLETMEPTQVVELAYSVLREWQQRYPAVGPLLEEAMACMVLSQTQRESQLLALTPTERYAAFVLEHGALSARIPLHHVASYLGITNVSLSRIRARMGLIASDTPPPAPFMPSP